MLELNKQLLQTTLTFDGASIEDTHTLPSSTGTVIKIDAVKNTFSFAHVSDSYGIVYHKNGNSFLFLLMIKIVNSITKYLHSLTTLQKKMASLPAKHAMMKKLKKPSFTCLLKEIIIPMAKDAA